MSSQMIMTQARSAVLLPGVTGSCGGGGASGQSSPQELVHPSSLRLTVRVHTHAYTHTQPTPSHTHTHTFTHTHTHTHKGEVCDTGEPPHWDFGLHPSDADVVCGKEMEGGGGGRLVNTGHTWHPGRLLYYNRAELKQSDHR